MDRAKDHHCTKHEERVEAAAKPSTACQGWETDKQYTAMVANDQLQDAMQEITQFDSDGGWHAGEEPIPKLIPSQAANNNPYFPLKRNNF